MTEAQIYTVVWIASFIAIFLICREIVLWYLKVNRRIELMEKQCNQNVMIIEELQKLNAHLSNTEPDKPEEVTEQEAA